MNNPIPQLNYLPLGREDLNFGLFVTLAGEEQGKSGDPYPQPGHPQMYDFNPADGRVLPEYQLVFLNSGELIFSSEATGAVTVSAGQMLLLFPGVWHTYRPRSGRAWKDSYVGFNGFWIYELTQQKVFSQDCPILSPDKPEEIAAEFRVLLQNMRQLGGRNSLSLGASVVKILGIAAESNREEIQNQIRNEEKVEDPSGEDKFVRQAQSVIWGWGYRQLDVQTVAEVVCINRRTLNRYFCHVLGRSILEEINLCRVVRAKQLLENTHIPIGNIALAAGFSSLRNMERQFLQVYGKTAAQFRINK